MTPEEAARILLARFAGLVINRDGDLYIRRLEGEEWAVGHWFSSAEEVVTNSLEGALEAFRQRGGFDDIP